MYCKKRLTNAVGVMSYVHKLNIVIIENRCGITHFKMKIMHFQGGNGSLLYNVKINSGKTAAESKCPAGTYSSTVWKAKSS